MWWMCNNTINSSLNRLTAALGFRNAYMLEKGKNPYQYKALEACK